MAGLLSLVLWLLSAAIVWRTIPMPFTGWRQDLWLAGNLAIVVFWLVGLAMIHRQRPRWDRPLAWMTKALIVGCHALCCCVIWLIMPRVGLEQQLVIMVCLMAYSSTQVISSPENTLANRLGIILVLGSAALFFAARGSAAAQSVAIYAAAYAVVMLILSRVVAATVRRTFEAQLASDAAARLLERSLAAVAAERDAKTRFIATASHDLGQPLQSAALFFDQMVRGTDAATRAQAADGVRRSFAAAEQLLAHMLNHLRLEADAVEPQMSRVALQPLLARMAAQPGLPHAMRVRVAPTTLSLMLDPALIDRALGNLLQNAIVHSGGSRVLLAARRHGGRVRLWVIDDGMGVGRTDARHIFDDYYQGPSKQPGTGFGLGLSSVRRIARLMGGEAGLDPRWLHGAAFYLEFPAAAPAPAPASGRALSDALR